MKKRNSATILWCIASIAVLVAAVAAIAAGLTGQTVTLVDAAVLEEPARQALECARSGDFDALGEMLSGSPRLGTPCGDGDAPEDLLWNAYLQSIQYQFPGTYTLSGDSMELDVRMDCLDLSAAAQRINEAAAQAGQSRQAALREAAAQVLEEDAPTMRRDLKLTLIRAGSGWQVVPTPQLQQLLSGFITE